MDIHYIVASLRPREALRSSSQFVKDPSKEPLPSRNYLGSASGNAGEIQKSHPRVKTMHFMTFRKETACELSSVDGVHVRDEKDFHAMDATHLRTS